MVEPALLPSPNQKYCHACATVLDARAELCPKCGVRQPVAPSPPGPTRYAGFWLRLVALMIDGCLIGPVLGLFVFVLGVFAGIEVQGDAPMAALGLSSVASLAAIVGHWLYYALFESSWLRATPGKLALGLRVTDLAGAQLGFGRASGRYFGKWISGLTLGIGYLVAAFTEKKQALHDLMADCLVVKR